jgi:hypothetical protein
MSEQPERWQQPKRYVRFVRVDHLGSDQCEVPEVDAFLLEIEAVCFKHGMSIGHEDEHGAFLVHRYDADLMEWLYDAPDARREQR